MAGELKVGERRTTKAEMVAEVANDLIAELIERSRRADGVRDYYDIAIVGYSDDGVYSLLSSEVLSVEQLDRNCPVECDVEREYILEDGQRRFYRHHQRRWITPKACGSTPMYEALLFVYDLTAKWCALPENRNSHPPLLFNITDGESTDCDYTDIEEIASKIKALTTTDGNTLLFNVHIASESGADSMLFPSLEEFAAWSGESRCAFALYSAASDLPENFGDALREVKSTDCRESFKAMSFNSSVSELVTILNIGSISVKRG